MSSAAPGCRKGKCQLAENLDLLLGDFRVLRVHRHSPPFIGHTLDTASEKSARALCRHSGRRGASAPVRTRFRGAPAKTSTAKQARN